MLTTLEAARRLAHGYSGHVHGDDANGVVDIEFPTVHHAASFAESMTPDGALDCWSATCVLRDPVLSLADRVVLHVTFTAPTATD